MNGFDLSTISDVYVGSTQYSSIYLGSTQIWPLNLLLPYDAEVEYLDGDGTLYIDLNIIPDENTGVYVKTIHDELSSTYDNYLFGLRDNTSNTRWCIGHSNVRWYWGYGSYNTVVNNPYVGYIVEVTLNYLNSKTATCTVNNTTYTTNLPQLSFVPQNKIRIFGSSGVSANYAKWDGKIYSFKVSQGNTCIADLIPVRVGQIGYMYDKINNILYGNNGTGNFTFGPDKDVPNDYTKVEYISSTNGGNQYIDLGIKLYDTLNKDYDIAIKFMMSSTNVQGQATMFNCQDPNNNPWPGTYIRKNNSGSNIIGRYIGGTSKDNVIGQLDNIIELPVQTPPNKNVTNLNNNNSTHQYGAGLFCSFSDTNNTPQRCCNGTIYYFKLFVEGVLVRDMVPCINPNNTVGLYDLVNRTFYSSPNGNAFVAGPAV